MKKVFIVECAWNSGENDEHEIIGVFADKQDAIRAMNESFERDKKDSVFEHCFDKKGDFIEAEEDYSFTCREDHIDIYDNYSCEFIEYNVTAHKIK